MIVIDRSDESGMSVCMSLGSRKSEWVWWKNLLLGEVQGSPMPTQCYPPYPIATYITALRLNDIRGNGQSQSSGQLTNGRCA